METVTTAEFLEDSFDFLIIGGGTAGLGLAARLSEDTNVRLALSKLGSHDWSLMGYISYSSQVSKPELEGTISNLYYYPVMDERPPPQNDVFQRKQ